METVTIATIAKWAIAVIAAWYLIPLLIFGGILLTIGLVALGIAVVCKIKEALK
jgi:uncharacterized membrane protein